MNASELRIGNIVRFGSDDNYQEVIIIDGRNNTVHLDGKIQSGAVIFSDLLVDIADVQPIPITSEWLEQLGLEPQLGLFPSEYYLYGGIGLREEIGDGYVLMYYGPEETIDINEVYFIHHLQNIYHAVSGEELELKKY